MILNPQQFDYEFDMDWIAANAPLLNVPEERIQKVFYFRWENLRRNLFRCNGHWAFREFNVHDGVVSAAAGHHVYEARWLANCEWVQDYLKLFYTVKNRPEEIDQKGLYRYTSWLNDAVWAEYLVNGATDVTRSLLPEMIRFCETWTQARGCSDGLYWTVDTRDAMEYSLSSRYWSKVYNTRESQAPDHPSEHVEERMKRVSWNSYMYANSLAVSRVAELDGNTRIASQYGHKAKIIRDQILTRLWSEKLQFFCSRREPGDDMAMVREAIGFTPFMFNIPPWDGKYHTMWKQLMDKEGFYAPYGPTTAERRADGFLFNGDSPPKTCYWNGQQWPFATANTLKALAHLLRNYRQNSLSTQDYYHVLLNYTRCHYWNDDSNRMKLGESTHPDTGVWNSDHEWYNHSSYCDLIISDLIGLRPREDDTIEVCPLIPDNTWDWFCLDQVMYHGKPLTILYDKTGEQYHYGKGLKLFVDGQLAGESCDLESVSFAT